VELGLDLPPAQAVAKPINLTLGIAQTPQPAGAGVGGACNNVGSSSSPSAAPAGAGAMQRKGSNQLGSNGDKGAGPAAAAAGGSAANGSGSSGSSTIRAVPSQRALQPRPRTANSKGSKEAPEGLQICGGELGD
jgi:hypothetical protein